MHRIEEAKRVLKKLEANATRKVGRLPEPRPDLVVIEEPKFPTLDLFRKPYVYRLLLLIAMWFLWYIGNYGFLGGSTTLPMMTGFTVSSSILYLAVGAIGYPVGAAVMLMLADRVERKLLVFIDAVVWFVRAHALRPEADADDNSRIVPRVHGARRDLQVAYTYTAENFPTRARSSGFALTDGIGRVGGAFGALFPARAGAIAFVLHGLRVHSHYGAAVRDAGSAGTEVHREDAGVGVRVMQTGRRRDGIVVIDELAATSK